MSARSPAMKKSIRVFRIDARVLAAFKAQLAGPLSSATREALAAFLARPARVESRVRHTRLRAFSVPLDDAQKSAIDEAAFELGCSRNMLVEQALARTLK